jgi:hypothetical protein
MTCIILIHVTHRAAQPPPPEPSGRLWFDRAEYSKAVSRTLGEQTVKIATVVIGLLIGALIFPACKAHYLSGDPCLNSTSQRPHEGTRSTCSWKSSARRGDKSRGSIP